MHKKIKIEFAQECMLEWNGMERVLDPTPKARVKMIVNVENVEQSCNENEKYWKMRLTTNVKTFSNISYLCALLCSAL